MTLSQFAVPAPDRHFEDYVPGSVFEFGSISLSQPEMIDFARRYDPQPMHTDPEAATKGPYGGIIASGWHTGGAMMRLYVDNYLPGEASLGSPGVDELRWLLPVRPDDRLRIRVSVLETRRSRTKPDRGIVRSLIEVLNQKDEVVMSMRALNLMRCRNGG